MGGTESPTVPAGQCDLDAGVAPTEAKDGLGRIVVGFDGSPTSGDTLSYAVGVARRNRSPLIIVYVVPGAYLNSIHPIATGMLFDAALTAAGTVERQAGAYLDGLGVSWSFVRTVGDVSIEIERAADALHADVIIVGQSDHHWHRNSRSVAARLVRRACRPVIVVPRRRAGSRRLARRHSAA